MAGGEKNRNDKMAVYPNGGKGNKPFEGFNSEDMFNIKRDI